MMNCTFPFFVCMDKCLLHEHLHGFAVCTDHVDAWSQNAVRVHFCTGNGVYVIFLYACHVNPSVLYSRHEFGSVVAADTADAHRSLVFTLEDSSAHAHPTHVVAVSLGGGRGGVAGN